MLFIATAQISTQSCEAQCAENLGYSNNQRDLPADQTLMKMKHKFLQRAPIVFNDPLIGGALLSRQIICLPKCIPILYSQVQLLRHTSRHTLRHTFLYLAATFRVNRQINNRDL